MGEVRLSDKGDEWKARIDRAMQISHHGKTLIPKIKSTFHTGFILVGVYSKISVIKDIRFDGVRTY